MMWTTIGTLTIKIWDYRSSFLKHGISVSRNLCQHQAKAKNEKLNHRLELENATSFQDVLERAGKRLRNLRLREIFLIRVRAVIMSVRYAVAPGLPVMALNIMALGSVFITILSNQKK